MRFVSFFQRLGYLVFLQVLLLSCLAYSTFHVCLGHNFRLSLASFCYCCSYTYFILAGPFCFALFVFHSAPGADFVWNKIFLFVSAVRDRSSPGAGFVSEKMVWGIRSKTDRLWDPDFCLKPSISVYVQDRLGLGACSCLGRIFVGSAPGVGFLFFGTKYYSPVILWKKIGQPATNCNRRFFNGFRLCNVSLLTYQKSQKIPVWEVTKKRDLLKKL